MITCLDDWSSLFFFLVYGAKRVQSVEVVSDAKYENGWRSDITWVSMVDDNARKQLKEKQNEQSKETY